MAKSKKKFYAVGVGQVPGIYETWSGSDGAEAQVRGFPGARYKGFASLDDAQTWMNEFTGTRERKKEAPLNMDDENADDENAANGKDIRIYTDGGCINNPGPGGYGVVLFKGSKRIELSGGFRHTTNNRMELTACIEGLKHLESRASVVIFSDSRYVVNGIEKGWAKRWRSKGWMRTPDDPAENADLWQQLLDLCDFHDVEFSWVRGHAGNPENERCDKLATRAAAGKDLLRDTAFETNRTTRPAARPVQKGLFD